MLRYNSMDHFNDFGLYSDGDEKHQRILGCEVK